MTTPRKTNTDRERAYLDNGQLNDWAAGKLDGSPRAKRNANRILLAREVLRLRAALDIIGSPLSFDEETHCEAVQFARRALSHELRHVGRVLGSFEVLDEGDCNHEPMECEEMGGACAHGDEA